MAKTKTSKPLVAVVMGSSSDFPTMERSVELLEEFGVPHEVRVISAHRTPDSMFNYAEAARKRGLKCIIAGAGGSAHLPGMLASKTPVPVLGVPIKSDPLNGYDSLLSIVQMPQGVPVATFAIGKPGATNAALFAIRMLALENPGLAQKLARMDRQMQKTVKSQDQDIQSQG